MVFGGGISLCEGRHIFEKAFLLILSWEIAKFQFTKDRAVKKTLLLANIHPGKGCCHMA